MNETALLDQAVLAFERETGLALKQDKADNSPSDMDGRLRLTSHGIEYHVELKRWAQQANLGALEAQLSKLPAPALLVADYVNPNMADRLREAGIQYIDTAGNAYLNNKDLYIFIKGNRSVPGVSAPKKTSRAFNASGLKIIFSFLLEPQLINANYRTIAAKAGVSLGTIGWVLNDLKDKGYVQDRGKKRVLTQPIALLDRWVEAYPEKLLPELELGLFDSPYQLPWKDMDPTQYGGSWGGEVGASILDSYLSPAQGLIYLPKDRLKELVIDNRLKKSRESEPRGSSTLRVCESFWPNLPLEPHEKHEKNAPDILIYADLVATGEPRNLEAAERLYGRIKDRLRGD